MKPDYAPFFHQLKETPLEVWEPLLPEAVASAFNPKRHGQLPAWEEALAQLPELQPEHVELKTSVSVKGLGGEPVNLREQLQAFHPWRKGPYFIHGLHLDTEWRSDWKWDRLLPHLQPLEGKVVLDVGCGNGYHMWRMVGAGAKLAVGVDPTPLFVCQFFAIKHFLRDSRAWVLPLSLEETPPAPDAFDTVFSMGVLYHRRSPLDHLLDLRAFLRPGGELVLETLVTDGPEGYAFLPPGRYAKMRNVWFIPSVPTLESWVRRCGFHDVRTVDLTPTSVEEQRATDWMRFESLSDFLDPSDPTRTIEGHPAPLRAILLAKKSC